jgi:hypothetical protein
MITSIFNTVTHFFRPILVVAERDVGPVLQELLGILVQVH